MRKFSVILWGSLAILMFCNVSFADPVKITLLNDYVVTNDIKDIVRLGDAYSPTGIVSNPQGLTVTWQFQLSETPDNGLFCVHITHYQADPQLGYYDHIFVNGTDLGYLSTSPSHWGGDNFNGNTDILLTNGLNELEITSGFVGDNYDDFEFTNLYVTYQPIPLPSTILLLSFGMIFTRKRIIL